MMKDGNPQFVLGKLQRLFALCEKRCRNFKWFFVAAVGERTERKEDAPPMELHPKGVVSPMIWALRQFRRNG
jgi:hypothetical protein